MRAAASDPVTAYVLGIDVRATQRLTWIFAGIVGAFEHAFERTARGGQAGLSLSALGVDGRVDLASRIHPEDLVRARWRARASLASASRKPCSAGGWFGLSSSDWRKFFSASW